jgi:hypothetical protein
VPLRNLPLATITEKVSVSTKELFTRQYSPLNQLKHARLDFNKLQNPRFKICYELSRKRRGKGRVNWIYELAVARFSSLTKIFGEM